MRKIVLTFGLIAGAVMSAMLVLALPFQDQLGADRGAIFGYTSMVLAFLMTFVGVKTYRDTVAGGTISFGRAFSVGLLITLVATSCYVATWEVIFFGGKGDEFLATMSAHAIEKAKQSGASEAQIAAKMQEMDAFAASYRNPLVNIAYTFLEPLPVGLLFSLLAAGVHSRKRRAAAMAAPNLAA